MRVEVSAKGIGGLFVGLLSPGVRWDQAEVQEKHHFRGFLQLWFQYSKSSDDLFAKMSLPAYLHPAIIPDNNSVLQLDRQSLDQLTRFRMRAALSIGTARAARLYQTETVGLACAVRAWSIWHPSYIIVSFFRLKSISFFMLSPKITKLASCSLHQVHISPASIILALLSINIFLMLFNHLWIVSNFF